MNKNLDGIIGDLNTVSDEQERIHQAMHLLVAAIIEPNEPIALEQ
ncbi:hypothetical protein [Aneurinibacillus tyrosinisolvens]|nr:hypothetical protein [Aneurinibacillus tyrosinisolvens]